MTNVSVPCPTRRKVYRLTALVLALILVVICLPAPVHAATYTLSGEWTLNETFVYTSDMKVASSPVSFSFTRNSAAFPSTDEYTSLTITNVYVKMNNASGSVYMAQSSAFNYPGSTLDFGEADQEVAYAVYLFVTENCTKVATEEDTGSDDTGDDTGTTVPSTPESSIDPGDFTVIHYEDYIVETYFDGTSDVVTISFPTELVHTYAFTSDGTLIEDHVGSYSSTFTQADTRLLISLLGTDFVIDATNGYQYYSFSPTGGNILDLTDFPEGTYATFDIDIAYGNFYYGTSNLFQYALNDAFFNYYATYDPPGFTKYDAHFNLNCKINLNGDSEMKYGAYAVSLEEFNLGDYTLTVNSIRVTFSVDGLLSWYEQTGKTNKLLEEVIDKIGDTNDRLDDIISGGTAGEDLINKGDQIENAGSGLGGSIADITDFENKYFGDIDSGLDNVLAAFDVTSLSAPLFFIKDYIDRIMVRIPMQYALVFTLPFALGIFMYIVQHPIRAPSPDKSGDIVTRETFTTTTVLSGKNAGRSTTTKTVTTSHEIGRESN